MSKKLECCMQKHGNTTKQTNKKQKQVHAAGTNVYKCLQVCLHCRSNQHVLPAATVDCPPFLVVWVSVCKVSLILTQEAPSCGESSIC